jgi:predicted GNAT family acetyltransferase
VGAGNREASAALARFGFELSDEPRWVEAHGLLAQPDSWHRGWPGGGLIASEAAQLAVGLGRCDGAEALDHLTAVTAEHPALTVLCAEREVAEALAARTGRRAQRATLHTLAEPLEAIDLEVAPLPELDERQGEAAVEGDGAVEVAAAADLGHVPRSLRHELAVARRNGRVWSVWVEGLPVSFAHANWRSPRWFDVSVETLPGFRQLGLGEMVARALILDETAAGRAPVWGALEDNHASLRLAARLGFAAVDHLWVIAPVTAELGGDAP